MPALVGCYCIAPLGISILQLAGEPLFKADQASICRARSGTACVVAVPQTWSINLRRKRDEKGKIN